MASQRVPNISATRPDVGGTVESHISPVITPKASAEAVVIGSVMNNAIESARVK
jgi:hypothetical protein